MRQGQFTLKYHRNSEAAKGPRRILNPAGLGRFRCLAGSLQETQHLVLGVPKPDLALVSRLGDHQPGRDGTPIIHFIQLELLCSAEPRAHRKKE